jgi:acetoin utilization deacetylase AcuC-like enzyme
MGQLIRGLNLPVLTVLEGGYAVESIGRNAVAFLRGVDANSPGSRI